MVQALIHTVITHGCTPTCSTASCPSMAFWRWEVSALRDSSSRSRRPCIQGQCKLKVSAQELKGFAKETERKKRIGS